MRTKLLREARLRFQIEHRHRPEGGIDYRVVEMAHHEINPMCTWVSQKKIVDYSRRRLILNYCRGKYSYK